MLKQLEKARLKGKYNESVDDPLVSVVIPTYNYAKYIAAAINSVLKQSYRNIELIVIDDGSTDDTADVIAIYEGKLRYYFQKNQGLSAARNKGIELSNGRYIQFLDSDDILGADSIRSKVQHLNCNQNTAFVCCANQFIFEGKGRLYSIFKNFNF